MSAKNDKKIIEELNEQIEEKTDERINDLRRAIESADKTLCLLENQYKMLTGVNYVWFK